MTKKNIVKLCVLLTSIVIIIVMLVIVILNRPMLTHEWYMLNGEKTDLFVAKFADDGTVTWADISGLPENGKYVKSMSYGTYTVNKKEITVKLSNEEFYGIVEKGILTHLGDYTVKSVEPENLTASIVLEIEGEEAKK